MIVENKWKGGEHSRGNPFDDFAKNAATIVLCTKVDELDVVETFDVLLKKLFGWLVRAVGEIGSSGSCPAMMVTVIGLVMSMAVNRMSDDLVTLILAS